MAKELPYFKFEPSEWLEGEIQVCSDESIVCFINLCCGYWLKLGNINYAFALHKYCKKDASVLQELLDNKIITLRDDEINISFLDKQLQEFKNISEKRTNAANKRWDNKDVDANALQLQSKSNAIREDKIREEEIKENKKDLSLSLENDFILFWDKFNKKNDHKKCKDKFLKLKQNEINDILKVVDKYVLSTPEVKFRKNPLTWINGECWKDLVSDKKETVSANGEKIIKYISNVNPTPAFLEESKFLKMQEMNLAGGYIYKILP
jgi:hypothetical protein